MKKERERERESRSSDESANNLIDFAQYFVTATVIN